MLGMWLIYAVDEKGLWKSVGTQRMRREMRITKNKVSIVRPWPGCESIGITGRFSRAVL